MKDYFLQQKFNELIIPKTTITLTDNTSDNKGKMKPLHLKTPKDYRIKKTPTNNINNYEKYSSISQQHSKRSSSTNNNIETTIPKNFKKNSVKSIKIDFNQNNLCESNLNPNSNSNKSDKDKIENNITNVKAFKAEKINIDLTNVDNLEKTINRKINNIKLLKINKDKAKNTIQNGINTKFKSKKNSAINKNKINKKSQSNPKSSKEKNSKNKRLTLQEARYENKLKYDKIPVRKGELHLAQSFINNYQKMKSNNSLKKKQFKNINNAYNKSPITLLNREEEDKEETDTKSFFIDIQNLKINKIHNNIINLNLNKKKQKGENEDNSLIKNKNTIVCDVYSDNNGNDDINN
jgi:hypothetical protein